MKIGRILKTYRVINEIGVRALAAELGVSAATVSRIEKNNPMDQATMLALITWLFGRER